MPMFTVLWYSSLLYLLEFTDCTEWRKLETAVEGNLWSQRFIDFELNRTVSEYGDVMV